MTTATQTKHTPGPWEILDHAPGDYLRVANYAAGFQGTIAGRLVANGIRGEANARLIAAAPDLHAALQMICDAGVPLADAIESAMLAALAKVSP